MGVACVCAGAEVQLSGTEDKFLLQAKNATIGEIISGIQSRLNIKIQLSGSTPRQFTGAYAGSLRRVLSRLLGGEDYIIGSTADGMSIVLLDRNGGARNAAAVGTRVAGGQEETNPVQGWVPNGNSVTEPRPAASPPDQAPRAGAAQPVKLAAADGDAENNPAQGWTGALFPTPVAAAAPARQDSTDADKPQTTEVAKPQAEGTDGSLNVQGWEPAESPFKDLVANRAPVVADAPASAADQDEGNPNVQGYMPDWSPPESGRSVTRTMPMLPGAAIGAHPQ
jgi:hypothetical protein